MLSLKQGYLSNNFYSSLQFMSSIYFWETYRLIQRKNIFII
jgi:hypothetical protein